jgi:hypothetical protein
LWGVSKLPKQVDLIEKYKLDIDELKAFAKKNCPEIAHSLNLVAQVYLAKVKGVNVGESMEEATKLADMLPDEYGLLTLYVGAVVDRGYRGHASHYCSECWKIVKRGKAVCDDHPTAEVLELMQPTFTATEAADGEEDEDSKFKEIVLTVPPWVFAGGEIKEKDLEFRKVKCRVKYQEYKGVPTLQLYSIEKSEPYVIGLGGHSKVKVIRKHKESTVRKKTVSRNV